MKAKRIVLSLITGLASTLLALFLGGQRAEVLPSARMTAPQPALVQVGSSAEAVPSQLLSTTSGGTAKSSLPYDARLIDIRTVNPKIALDIRYATTNNFLKKKVYPVARCVLRGAAPAP